MGARYAILLVVDRHDVFVGGTVLPTLIAEWGLTKLPADELRALSAVRRDGFWADGRQDWPQEGDRD